MAVIMPTLWGMLWPAEPLIQAEQMLHGAEPSLVLLLVVARVEGTQLIHAWVSPQSEVNICFYQLWTIVKVLKTDVNFTLSYRALI